MASWPLMALLSAGLSPVAVGCTDGAKGTSIDVVPVGDTANTTGRHVVIGAADDVLFGRELEPVGDFDGDGFVDVAVAAYALSIGAPTGVVTQDRVYVLGGPVDLVASNDRPSTSASVAVITSRGADEFGRVMGAAGDVNADGVDDLWVGTFSEISLVIGGRRGGLDASDSAVRIVGAGFSRVAPADANLDGIVDVLVSGVPGDGGGLHEAYSILGAPAGSVPSGWEDAFARIRHDACPVAVGAPSADLDGDGALDWLLRSVECVDGPAVFGVEVTQSGLIAAFEVGLRILDEAFVKTVVTADVNGDGSLDVGALSSSGALLLLGPFGTAAGSAASVVEVADDRSVVISALGDVDADGAAALLIGDSVGDGGVVRLIEGFADGAAPLHDFPALFESEAYSGPVGLAAGHDLDQDGVEDVAIGVPERDPNGANGVVYLLSGASLAEL